METSSHVSSDQIVSSFRRTTRITFFNERNVHLIRSNVFFSLFFYRVKRVSFRGFYLRYIEIKKKKKKGTKLKTRGARNLRGKFFYINQFRDP